MVDVQSQERTLTLVNHADWVTSLSFNPVDPSYFLSTSLDKTIKIWKNGYNKEIKTLDVNEPVWNARFSADGKYIVAATEVGTLMLISFVN